MRVRNFIVADAVSPGLQGKMFVHGGGVTSIAAAAFPYVHPQLGLLLTLVYEGPEDDIEQRVQVAIENNEGDEVATVLDLETDKPSEPFEERKSFLLIHLLGEMAGLQFEKPGRYWMVLKLNGEELDRMMLDATLVEMPS